MTPAVIQARGASLELRRVHADGGRHHRNSRRFKTLQPDLAVAESLHRRHRIGFAGGPPFFLGPGVAGNADLARDLVVEGRHVGIGDRPVVGAVVLAPDFEIGRQITRKVGVVVQRRAADTPSALRGIGHRVLAFEQDRRAGRLDAAAPYLGTDEVGEFPVRTGLDQHDLLAGLRQHRRIDRAGCAGANDNDVYFLVASSHHLFSGGICGI